MELSPGAAKVTATPNPIAERAKTEEVASRKGARLGRDREFLSGFFRPEKSSLIDIDNPPELINGLSVVMLIKDFKENFAVSPVFQATYCTFDFIADWAGGLFKPQSVDWL